MSRVPGLAADPERAYAPPAPDPLAVRDLRQAIRRFRPDVVHAHNWLVHSYLPLERRSGAAFVLSLHDYSLVCATKRFFYKGGVCSGPGAAQVPRPLDLLLRGGEGGRGGGRGRGSPSRCCGAVSTCSSRSARRCGS